MIILWLHRNIFILRRWILNYLREGLTHETYIKINPPRMRKTENKQVWQNSFNFEFRWYMYKHSFYYIIFCCLIFFIIESGKMEGETKRAKLFVLIFGLLIAIANLCHKDGLFRIFLSCVFSLKLLQRKHFQYPCKSGPVWRDL